MAGWRVCGAAGAGLISYARLGGPLARVQDAICDQGCPSIPGTGCRCGWYVCNSVGDLRPLVTTYQYHVDRGADHVDLALVGVQITHPMHTLTLRNNAEGREFSRRLEEVVGVRRLESIEGDGTYRGRRLTITGPIVTTLSDPEAIKRLRRKYEADVIPTSHRMLDVIDLLRVAGSTHGHSVNALSPHLQTLLTPAATTTPRRPAMPAKKAVSARKPRPVATTDHLTPTKSMDGSWTGTLGGAEIRVLPFNQWRKSAMQAINRGNFDLWADGAVHPDDVQDFVDADVTMGEVMAFMGSVPKELRHTPGPR